MTLSLICNIGNFIEFNGASPLILHTSYNYLLGKGKS